MGENVYANHRVYGDYVLTGIPNAFNNKTSYWMSKKNFTLAVYCFSASCLSELNEALKNIKSYIRYFEATLESSNKQ